MTNHDAYYSIYIVSRRAYFSLAILFNQVLNLSIKALIHIFNFLEEKWFDVKHDGAVNTVDV
jgi:hypothetical protein